MNVAEILISAKEELAGLQRVKNELKALGNTAQDTARRAELAGKLMTMGVEPDRAIRMVAQSWVDADNKIKKVHSTLLQGQEAAGGFARMLGIELPQAATRFLARSEAIGPILAGAFTTVGVLALVQALGQVPEMFEKLSGAITGWDEKSRKAYERFIEDNQKAVEAVEKVRRAQIDLLGVSEESKARLVIGGLQDQLAEQNKLIVATEKELALREQLKQLSPEATTGTGLLPTSSDSVAELQKRLEGARDAAKKLAAEIREKQQIDVPRAAAAEIKKLEEEYQKLHADLIAIRKQYKAWSDNELEKFRIQAGTGGEAVAAGLKVADDAGKAVIKDFQELLKLEEEAGDNLIKFNQWKEQQLQDFRNRSNAGGPMADEVKAGQEANDIRVKGILKERDELKKAREDFLRSFREGAGKVWDDFFIQGKHILTSLADLARALFNQIGRTLFQNFATGLLTGGKQGAGGGIGGIVGNVGAGIGMKTGLGALFGGGGAAAVSGSLAPGAVGIINPATGALVTGTSAGATGGVAGALGLGGGAGLFGLGAATIPVIGGIALGAFLLARHFLGHKTQEAPFTKDPFTESQHMVEFYTSAQVQATRDLRIAIEHLQGISPDEVVTQGMPLAFQSSNQFRRNMTSTLMDDV